MSTIAYRDGVLAGDSLLTQNYANVGMVRKIGRNIDGSIIGGAVGCLSDVSAFIDYIQTLGPLMPNFPAGHAAPPASPLHPGEDSPLGMVIIQHKRSFQRRIFLWEGTSRLNEVVADYLALGSGKNAALGAMEAGASAKRAVEIACMIDPYSGLPVDWRAFEQPSQREAAGHAEGPVESTQAQHPFAMTVPEPHDYPDISQADDYGAAEFPMPFPRIAPFKKLHFGGADTIA
jgi:hypothetical protein